jgi:hypothetical protein
VLKSWEINDAVVREFWPSLVPGQAIIVQQDYHWGGHPWLAITMEQFRECFERLDAMSRGTVVFRLVRELPDLREITLSQDLSDEEKLALMDRAVDRETAPVGKAMLRLSRAVVLTWLGHPRQAQAEISDVLSSCENDDVADAADQIAAWLMHL